MGKHKDRLDSVDKKLYDEIIKEFIDITESLNLPCFLIMGTLLGFVRDGDFIPYDQDIDFGLIHPGQEPISELTSKLTENGFVVNPKVKQLHITKKGVLVDIWFYTPVEGGYETSANNFIHGDLLEPLGAWEFNGHLYRIPNDPELYLKLHYGPDWKTPIHVKGDWRERLRRGRRVRIGINGFGRIGRILARIIQEQGELELVAIKDYNNLGISDKEYTSNLAYLLSHDSIYGEFPCKVSNNGMNISINDREVPICLCHDIDIAFWDDNNVDIIVDSSGATYTYENYKRCITKQPCYNGTVRKVVITRGFEESDFIYVVGVNNKDYDRKTHNIISASTCTGNASIPVIKVIDDRYKIKNGFISSIHSTLTNENILDTPHKVFQLGKSSISNIKPTPSRVSKSIIEVIPELENIISDDAMSYRVPVDNGVAIYAILETEKEVDRDKLIKYLSESPVIDVYSGYNNNPTVSSEFRGDNYSCVVDTNWLKVNRNLLRIHIWHDNEYGYCSRIHDVLTEL